MPTPEQRAAVDAELARKPDSAFADLVRVTHERAKLRTFQLPNRPLPRRANSEDER